MEDDFDGQNRMNLRHFIRSNESKKPQADDDDEVSLECDYPTSYYYIQNPEMAIDDKAVEERKDLQRIPTFAVFHKLAPGKGVPHTFVGKFDFLDDHRKVNSRLLVGFVRQWPALPRVVVRIYKNDLFPSHI